MAQKCKDLTGQTFGHLTVVSYAGPTKRGSATWNCKCSCGMTKVIRTDHLTSKETMSCGCKKSELQTKQLAKNRAYRIGQTFNDLTILEYVKYAKGMNASMYKCKCSCGNIVICRLVALTKGVSNSCGCKNSEKRSLAKGGSGIPHEKLPLYKTIRKCSEYGKWREAILSRDNYACQISNVDWKHETLHVHHINSLSFLVEKYHITKNNLSNFRHILYDINNGITIAEGMHEQFHIKYGYGNNTEQQLIDFKLEYANATTGN